MSYVFDAEGLRELRGSWIVLAATVVAAVAVVATSSWLLQRERQDRRISGTRVEEARARVETARQEHDSMYASREIFQTLVARGVLQPERRLDLVEHVNALRNAHRLFSLDYEISPQRPLALPGGRSFPAIDVLASRVKFRARALHEGDLLAFVDELEGGNHGFYPVDRCVLRRLTVGDPFSLEPRVEANCSLEWITLKDKRAN